MATPYHNPAFSHDFGAQLWGLGESPRPDVIESYRNHVGGSLDDSTVAQGWQHIAAAYERDYR